MEKENLSEKLWRLYASTNIKLAEMLDGIKADPMAEGLSDLRVSDCPNMSVLNYWLEDVLCNIQQNYLMGFTTGWERFAQVFQALDEYVEQKDLIEYEENKEELLKQGYTLSEIEMSNSI